MKMLSSRYQLKLFVVPVILGLFHLQAQAQIPSPIQTLPHLPGKAHAPHIIKPNTPQFAPSGLSPAQVAMAYGFAHLTGKGKGQIIGIVDAFDAPTIEKDLNVFSSTFGLPACTTKNGCFKKIYAAGKKPSPDGDWAGETSLDVEWAHAMAPQAKIMLVEAKDDSMDALMQAVQVAVKNGANVISMSWGGAEDANETSIDAIFNQPHVVFTAASGDSGHGVIYPAASPYVLSVGGTTLSIGSSGNYLGETAWSGSGGGLSAYEVQPEYQSSYPIPNNPNKMRGTPDVSYNADPESGVSVYDSTRDSSGNKGWMVIGGTSAAAPQWAALIADANSSGKYLTNINALLYSTATSNYANDYNDITLGNNGDCGIYCSAQVNYDYVTGLGSPKAANLIMDLNRILKS